ncbi:esterase/lipase family protein [Streptomyces sp. NPDC017988]|uniref:esterase/lipase family protein n=1 Tax=Streptomyces sp. NPDC017988 TaxID=3365025 RepID=UPI0037B8645F
MINSPLRIASVFLVAAVPLLPVPAVAKTAAPRPDPVVFVHGFASDGSTWKDMAGRFRSDGWPVGRLHQWSYNPAQSNATTARQLARKIDRVLKATRARKVDLVTHSMGALSSRHYLKNHGGLAKVDAFVSLAGPNHGTDLARWCGDPSCVEMRPNSVFLKALNAGDETPGAVRYATWSSPCDQVVTSASTALSGATNNKTACLSHTRLHADPGVYKEVKDHVD